jgi:hypothetical protein
VVTDLVRNLDHLAEHRRMILGRSLAAGVLGAVPVPLLDDWLQAVVRRGTIRSIAERRRVDLDEEAVRAVADGKVAAPGWRALVAGGFLSRLLSRTLRRVLLAITLASRADAITRSFAVGTLFDHYCSRVHVGAGLDGAAGRRVREAIDGAIAARRGGLASRLVRRGLVAAARTAVRAPLELADVATGGLMKRLLGRRDEADAEEVVERAVATAGKNGFLARATQAVEAQLALAGRGWMDDLILAFEERLRD